MDLDTDAVSLCAEKTVASLVSHVAIHSFINQSHCVLIIFDKAHFIIEWNGMAAETNEICRKPNAFVVKSCGTNARNGV